MGRENLLQNIFLAFFMLRTLNIRITIAVVPPTTLNRCTVMLRHTEYVSQSGTGPELIPIGSIFWQVSHLWFVLGKRSRSRVSQCAHLRAWVSARQFFRARDGIQRQSCKKKKKERRSISCRHENNTEVSYLRSSEARRNRGTISCVQFYRTDKSIAAISYIVSRSILAIGFIRVLFAIAIAAGQIKK